MEKVKKEDFIQTSFWENGDFMVEEIYNTNLKPEIQFCVFDKRDGSLRFSPNFNTGEKVLKPIGFNLVKAKSILLPTSAIEYESESALIDEIENFINRYLDLPHAFYTKLVSHYILLTWVYDKLTVVPYLRALGDYGSGKTRFAQVVGSLAYKPLFLAGASSDAFIFRMIELFKGTLVLNELERVNTDIHSQLVIILNNGYEKGLSVGRVEGEKKKEPVMFDVFSPKIITGRQKFKDLALESRILSIPMRPTKRTDIPSLLGDVFWKEAEDLRNKLLMYRFNNLSSPVNTEKVNDLLKVEPRLRQTLLPIFYVIQDEETEKRFTDYALQFQGQVYSDRSLETEALIAEKLVNLFDGSEKVNVKEVAESVNAELPEKERITYKTIGQKIRGFGFETKRTGGVYQVVFNQATIDYLKERYSLGVESPQSHQSPQTASDSTGDNGDFSDIEQSVNEIFGIPTPEAKLGN